jgi:hypothetical protein
MRRLLSFAFVVSAVFLAFSSLLSDKVLAQGGNFQVETVTDDGFGVTDPQNIYAYEMKEFNGKFYTTMMRDFFTNAPGGLWVSETGNPGSWTMVNVLGEDDNTNFFATSMDILTDPESPFDDYLYVAFSNTDGCKIYRSSDGTAWEEVVGTTVPSITYAGFGNSNNVNISHLRNFNNSLWAFTDIGDVWTTLNGMDWVQQNSFVLESDIQVMDIFVFGGKLNVLAREVVEYDEFDNPIYEMAILSTDGLGDPIVWDRSLETAVFNTDMTPTNGMYATVRRIMGQDDVLLIGNEGDVEVDAGLWYMIDDGESDFQLIEQFEGAASVFPVVTSRGVFAVVFYIDGFNSTAKLYRIAAMYPAIVYDTGITFDIDQLGAIYGFQRVTTAEFGNYFYAAGGGEFGTIYRVDLAPASNIPTAVQKTDGSGKVEITFTVGDIFDSDLLRAKVEYDVGDGFHNTTLDTTDGSYSTTYPYIGINNSYDYQVGGILEYLPLGVTTRDGSDDDYIQTSSGPNTITITWLSKTDEPTATLNDAKIRITISDSYGLIVGAQKVSLDSTVDNVAPVFSALNLAGGQLVSTNPFLIRIKASEITTEVRNLLFYVDGNLICDVNTIDSEGYYTCSWDTSVYQSDIMVVVYDTMGNSTSTTVNTTVNLRTLTRTGDPVLLFQIPSVVAMGLALAYKLKQRKNT